MKFAVVNDIHVGPSGSGYYHDIQRKLVDSSEKLLKKFVIKMNKLPRAKFVVNLGDSIEDVDNATVDIKNFKKVWKILSELKVPIYYLVGNHDVKSLSEKNIAKTLGYEKMYYSFEQGAYHFIALSFVRTADHKAKRTDIKPFVSQEQVRWLKEDLAKTTKPTVVFTHYGLADDNMKGNFWFESNPHKAVLANRHEIRKILEDSHKVIAVISAHQHWNRMHVHSGIPYFTVTSLVENSNNDGVPAEAYTIVKLIRNKITVKVYGNDNAKYKYSVKK